MLQDLDAHNAQVSMKEDGVISATTVKSSGLQGTDLSNKTEVKLKHELKY